MLEGTETHRLESSARCARGLSYIPEDRHDRGLVLPFSLTENMLLGNARVAPFSTGGRIDYARTREIAATEMKEFDVRAPGPETPAGALSGGNQQKFIIARELYREPKVILAVQPTRGLDVGAIEFVHGQLVAERDKGRGVLLISFDLDEIIDLSDRILVIYQGKIVGDFPSGKVTRAECGLLMGGKVGADRGRADPCLALSRQRGLLITVLTSVPRSPLRCWWARSSFCSRSKTRSPPTRRCSTGHSAAAAPLVKRWRPARRISSVVSPSPSPTGPGCSTSASKARC